MGLLFSALFCSSALLSAATELYIVAHQDDDLLFMNPDLQTSIDAGNAVRVVYLTAGNAGQPEDDPAWKEREKGVRAAYKAMAGGIGSWSNEAQTIGGRTIRVSTLAGANIELIFLRLPDPIDDGADDLLKLWYGDSASLSSFAPANTYNKQELTDLLLAIMEHYAPDHIGALDSSRLHDTFDHTDHIASGLFALHARHRYTTPHTFSMYVTYSTAGVPVNLSAAEADAKSDVFDVYAAFDPTVPTCTSAPSSNYCLWIQHQVVFSMIAENQGRIGTADGRCLIVAGAIAEGSPLELGGCGSAGAIRWNSLNRKLSVSGLCATAVSGDPPASSPLTLTDCTVAASKRFTVMANGQIRGPMATCLVEASGVAVLTDCASASANGVLWNRQTGAADFRSVAGDFSDADVGLAATTAQTLRLGDLDGDGRSDACIRRGDGIWCAPALAGGDFAAYTRWTSQFSDSNRWDAEPYGTTIQLGDINGDGRADVCGRRADGMFCAVANNNGTAFTSASLRTTAFGDGTWDTQESFYRSIRLGDVDGDGTADVCGRRGNGAWCAINDGVGQFGAAVHWISTEFTGTRGWNTLDTGATVQLADVDGDGKTDLCGRHAQQGIVCARSTGSAFTRAHQWSYLNQLSNADGLWSSADYALSIRFGDIDGDRAADLCGRTANGVECAISNGGNSFNRCAHSCRANIRTRAAGLPSTMGRRSRSAISTETGAQTFAGPTHSASSAQCSDSSTLFARDPMSSR